MLLSGVFAPITTPFYPDGEVYYKKIEANVERYSRTPLAGIVVEGSTGEAILLSDQERRDVLKAAIGAAAPSKVMIAGTGVESAHETLRLTDYAAELGYDAAMVRTPHYFKKQMKPENLLAFFYHLPEVIIRDAVCGGRREVRGCGRALAVRVFGEFHRSCSEPES